MFKKRSLAKKRVVVTKEDGDSSDEELIQTIVPKAVKKARSTLPGNKSPIPSFAIGDDSQQEETSFLEQPSSSKSSSKKGKKKVRIGLGAAPMDYDDSRYASTLLEEGDTSSSGYADLASLRAQQSFDVRSSQDVRESAMDISLGAEEEAVVQSALDVETGSFGAPNLVRATSVSFSMPAEDYISLDGRASGKPKFAKLEEEDSSKKFKREKRALADSDDSSNESDDEMDAWEEEMLRRGGGGSSSSTSSSLMSPPSNLKNVVIEPSAFTTQGRMTVKSAKNTLLSPATITSTLEKGISSLSAKIEDDEKDLERARFEMKETGENESELKREVEKATRTYEWSQQIRGVLADHVGAVKEFDGKVKLVLCSLTELIKEIGGGRARRRRRWVKDMGMFRRAGGDEEDIVQASSGGVDEFGREIKLVRSNARDSRKRKEVARLNVLFGGEEWEAERFGEMRDREVMGVDEEREQEVMAARRDALAEAVEAATWDIQEEYLDVAKVIGIFRGWRKDFPAVYNECYGDLLLSGIVESYANKEVAEKWNGVEVGEGGWIWENAVVEYEKEGLLAKDMIKSDDESIGQNVTRKVILPMMCTTLECSYDWYCVREGEMAVVLFNSIFGKVLGNKEDEAKLWKSLEGGLMVRVEELKAEIEDPADLGDKAVSALKNSLIYRCVRLLKQVAYWKKNLSMMVVDELRISWKEVCAFLRLIDTEKRVLREVQELLRWDGVLLFE